MTVVPSFMARQFVRFCVVGVGNTIIDFGFYLWLTRQVGWHYLLANGVAFLIANGCSFWLNRTWTFSATGAALGQYGRFLFTSVIALILVETALAAGVQLLGWSDILSKLVGLSVAVIFSFTVHRLWSFGPR